MRLSAQATYRGVITEILAFALFYAGIKMDIPWMTPYNLFDLSPHPMTFFLVAVLVYILLTVVWFLFLHYYRRRS